MIRRIVWLEAATDDLRDIDWKIAADVVTAVKLFALTGDGDIVRFPNLAGADDVRLYAPPHRHYARIRYSDTVIYVERILLSP